MADLKNSFIFYANACLFLLIDISSITIWHSYYLNTLLCYYCFQLLKNPPILRQIFILILLTISSFIRTNSCIIELIYLIPFSIFIQGMRQFFNDTFWLAPAIFIACLTFIDLGKNFQASTEATHSINTSIILINCVLALIMMLTNYYKHLPILWRNKIKKAY